MKLELAQTHFSGGVGDFEIGHVLTDTEGNPEIEISANSVATQRLTRRTARNTRRSTCISADGSVIDADALDRAVFIEKRYAPVSPDWFVDCGQRRRRGTGRYRGTAQGENRSRAQGKRQIRPSH